MFAQSNLTVMQVYQIWLIAAFVLVVVEILTAVFGSICLTVGAGLDCEE